MSEKNATITGKTGVNTPMTGVISGGTFFSEYSVLDTPPSAKADVLVTYPKTSEEKPRYLPEIVTKIDWENLSMPSKKGLIGFYIDAQTLANSLIMSANENEIPKELLEAALRIKGKL